MIILLYTAFLTPYKIAFLEQDSSAGAFIDNLIDVLFFVDIFINFLTTFDDVK